MKIALLSRQQVALVVAHELAHQWFGNDEMVMTWLNESFANMMEYVSVMLLNKLEHL
ncbi:MAG: M1 family aminopeptidase [Streptococcus sp.]